MVCIPAINYANPDLWDLGEFDQKGTTRTKWGSFEDLLRLAKLAQDKNVLLYFDAVLNHKAAADHTEKCRALECNWDGTPLLNDGNGDRNKTEGEPVEIEGWLGFDFPGRNNKYSEMKWHWYHFTGTDWVNEFCGLADLGQCESEEGHLSHSWRWQVLG